MDQVFELFHSYFLRCMYVSSEISRNYLMKPQKYRNIGGLKHPNKDFNTTSESV